MAVTALDLFHFDNSFVRELPGLYQWWQADSVADPSAVIINTDLAAELGLDAELLASPDGIALYSLTRPRVVLNRWRWPMPGISSGHILRVLVTVARCCWGK